MHPTMLGRLLYYRSVQSQDPWQYHRPVTFRLEPISRPWKDTRTVWVPRMIFKCVWEDIVGIERYLESLSAEKPRQGSI